MPRPRGDRTLMIASGAALAGAALTLFFAERKRPLRRPTQVEPARSIANLALGAISMATVALVEMPLTRPLAARAQRDRRGVVQMMPLPDWLRDAAAVLLMDYTIYLWHIATHKVPLLWRFHLVHHIDLDLDTTTALRFHGIDMAISAPVRAAQVAVIGVSPRALAIWQRWFFISVLFHHSNLRLPERFERLLARFVTTPRMHGIHHSAVRSETDSNWSSGFALWDHLHRTFRLDVPQDKISIGVPAYRDPNALRVLPSLEMPFGPEHDAWSASPVRNPTAIQ
ncbi:sterol desaturase family protein [Sphingomonas oligophenolica]|uniref:Sterol desaturase family protein n=2 Tax=Sphingomonas oligophenolica TaxID=301154 RepID=A0A502CS98_9SPHN|nr:sterol desaturase family protein [Sphingomonas oligophenolica]